MKFIRVIRANEIEEPENYRKLEKIVESLKEPYNGFVDVDFNHDSIDVQIGVYWDYGFEFTIDDVNHIGKAIAEEEKNYNPDDTIKEWIKEGQDLTEDEIKEAKKEMGFLKKLLKILAQKTKSI